MAGYSATQIYQMLNSGPGTTGIYHATDGAATQASTQDDLNNQIIQLNQKMSGAWTGHAAEQAQAGAMPLANAAQDATNSLAVHQSVMTGQAEAFTTARNSVTNVPSTMPNNIGNDFLAAFGDTGPLDDQITQYNNASQNNVQVYQNYSAMSSLNADTMPQDYGSIPVSNATITVLPPSSTGASGGYAGMNSVAAIAGGSAAEREEALRRLSAAPGANGGEGATGLDETSGAIGSTGAPPSGNGTWRLPNEPGEPNIGTNAEGFVPTALEDEELLGGIPGAGRNRNKDDEAAPPPPNFNQSFSGDLGGGPGGGSAQAAMESLHGGAGLGSGSGASNLTASSRSGIGMASQTAEESMMSGSGGGMGPGGAGMGEEGAMGGGMGGRREEDSEHKAASYLQEADPDALFGTDEMTAPPVIGE